MSQLNLIRKNTFSSIPTSIEAIREIFFRAQIEVYHFTGIIFIIFNIKFFLLTIKASKSMAISLKVI